MGRRAPMVRAPGGSIPTGPTRGLRRNHYGGSHRIWPRVCGRHVASGAAPIRVATGPPSGLCSKVQTRGPMTRTRTIAVALALGLLAPPAFEMASPPEAAAGIAGTWTNVPHL